MGWESSGRGRGGGEEGKGGGEVRDCIRYKRMGRGKGKGWSIPRCYRWLEDAEEKEDVEVEAKRRILKPILARGRGGGRLWVRREGREVGWLFRILHPHSILLCPNVFPKPPTKPAHPPPSPSTSPSSTS